MNALGCDKSSEITEFIRMFVAQYGQLPYCSELTGKDCVVVTWKEARLCHIDRVWSRWVPTEEVRVLSRRHPLNDGINYAQLVLWRQVVFSSLFLLCMK